MPTPSPRPADSLISEDRLLKFLEARKRVLAVYEKHRNTLETWKGMSGLEWLGL